MNATELFNRLRNLDNLYQISHQGQQKLWYGMGIPHEAISSEDPTLLHSEIYTSSNGGFNYLISPLAGWLIYQRHTGGMILTATLFLKLEPAQEALGEIIINSTVPFRLDQSSDRIQFGGDERLLSGFVDGIVNGLQSVLYFPISDLRVTLINSITDVVETKPKACELVGTALCGMLITEAYKSNLLRLHLPNSGEVKSRPAS